MKMYYYSVYCYVQKLKSNYFVLNINYSPKVALGVSELFDIFVVGTAFVCFKYSGRF